MAERVMRMPVKGSNVMPETGLIGTSIQRKCSSCEEGEKKKKSIMRKTDLSSGGMRASDSLVSSLNATKGRGSPLPQGTRSFMENAFSTDFSGVRVHTSHEASEMSKGVNAKAFTHGRDIYFNNGMYQPEVIEGKRLLAHELTHVMQQDMIYGTQLQRTSQAAVVNNALGLGPMYSYNDAYLILSPLNSIDMLDTLLDMANSSSSIIQQLIDNLSGAIGPVGIDRLSVYFLSVKNALFQNNMSSSELSSFATLISTLPMDQQRDIHSFTHAHRTSVTRDLYAGTHLPTATEQGNVETILNPGATFSAPVAPGAPVSITLPSPDPVCSNVPGFSTRIRAVLVPQINSGATAFRTRRAAGPNFPIASANTMADLAQNETENYFRPYLARASRSGAAGTYTLGGSTRASALLRDQSTTPRWRTTPGRLSWLKYWYDHQTGNLNDTLNCDPSQIETTLTTMATDVALIPDIDDYINGWPAEATGGINIQPYLDSSQLVCQRWDTFTIIIHEFLHLLAHPNFQNARGALPNNGLEILKEGMDDVLRKELWEGTGRLRAHLISPGRNTDRATIEGGTYPLQISKVCNHSYYDNLPEAESITGIVGRNNVKLAYFLGQTEYLGLGTGTTTASPGALATTSFYSTADVSDQDVVSVLPGETRDQLLLRTNGNQIRDLANSVLAVAAPLPPSVRVPGIRKVYVHANDSVISIATQNGVSPYEILRANHLTTTSVVVGSRLIIPMH